MSEPNARVSRNRILRWAGTLLAVGLLVYLLSRQGWQEFFAAVRSIPLSTFAVVLVMAVLSRLAVAGRWASLLILSGVKVSIPRILKITFAGMFASNFLPTSIGGDIVRFAETFAIDNKKRVYASSIVMDRLIGGLGMASVLPLGITSLISGPGLPLLRDWIGSLPFVGGAIGLAGESPRQSRAERWLRLLRDTTSIWLRTPRAIGVAFLFTWLYMLLKFGAIWLMFRAMGESISLVEVSGLWAFVYIINLFPLSINTLGIQEVSAGFIYSAVGGVGETAALAVAILLRSTEMIASLPGSIALPGLLERLPGRMEVGSTTPGRGEPNEPRTPW